ncbi:MAG: hypothetical protein U5K79_24145 [Cyclobacteriaceae bacterium]|nr:hypothetical protein [Cyclobacteriaceae bacterium]
MTQYSVRPKLPIFGSIFFVVIFLAAESWNTIAIGQSDFSSFEYLQEKYPEIDVYMDQVAMDPQGFVLLGGEIQIQRYDGYRVKTYPIRSTLEQSGESISPDAAPGFLTDSYGNFWVFSNIGLFVYQPAFDGFTRVCFNAPTDFFYQDSEEKPPDVFEITTIMEDSRQNLWVGLKGGVLFYFPLGFLEDLKEKSGFLANSVWIPEDKISPVWFQSDHHTAQSSEYVRTPYFTFPAFRPEVLKLLQDKDGDIWINSHSRIFRLIQKNKQWVFGGSFFKNYPDRFYWTKNLFLDREKNLWIGAANYLVLKRPGRPHKDDFENIPPKFRYWTLPYGQDSLSQSVDFHFDWYEFSHDMGFQGHTGWIDNLYFDNRDQLFVLNENVVYGYRLSWNPAQEPVFTKNLLFEKDENDPGTFWKSNASGIYLTEERILISGDWPFGVVKLNLSNRSGFQKQYHVDGNKNSLPRMNYSAIYDLGGGRILIGGSNNELYVTDRDFTFFRKLPLEIGFGGSVDNFIQSILPDGTGGLWITNFIGQLAYFREECVDNSNRKDGCTYQFGSGNFEGMNGRLNVVGMGIDMNRQLWIACSNGLYWLDFSSIDADVNWKNVVFNAFDKNATQADSTKGQPLRRMIPVKPDFYLMVTGDSIYQFDPLKREYHAVICEGDLSGNNPLLGIAFYDLAGDGTLWTTDFIKNSAITFK